MHGGGNCSIFRVEGVVQHGEYIFPKPQHLGHYTGDAVAYA